MGCLILGLIIAASIVASLTIRQAGPPGRPHPRPSQRVLNAFRDLFADLAPGRVAWNPPLQMQQGKSYTVESRVAFGRSPMPLVDMIGDGPVQLWKSDLSDVVQVSMTGAPADAFTIESHTELEQTLSRSGGYLRWLWDVKPTRPGDHELLLNIALVDVDPFGKDRKRVLLLPPRRVHVEVSAGYAVLQFVHENMAVVISTLVPIVGGIGGFVWHRARKKKRAGF